LLIATGCRLPGRFGLTFLEVKGFALGPPTPELAEWVLAFAGAPTPEQLAAKVSEAMRPTG
jgi:hypothetical protein